MEWENGEITPEPLSIIAKDAPVACAIYARDNNLLDTPGWKRFRKIAKNQKKLLRMANQAKLRSFRTAPKYMYGYEIPKDYNDALRLDRLHGNTKWQDATQVEMDQLMEYKVFVDLGKGTPVPKGYQKIRVHLVYACKHDGRHKARLVANGNLTEVPVDSVYSGVVSIRGLKLMVFLAELNGLEVWGTDIGNAYLEAYTKEQVCIIAGPEFGSLHGHTLIVSRALYGLRMSGKMWHQRFSAVLEEEGFFPCRAEPDVWMRKSPDGNCYEYVGVYVDDLAVAMRDPKTLLNKLVDVYKFKLKGTGPLEFHLGCDFYRDDEGVLCMHPRKYIERMTDNYERIFGEKPKTNIRSPLEKGDHPECDTSELLGPEGTTHYQSLIGQFQWAISLGRLDVATAVMTMSSFRSAPRV
ncbi:MAG: reverse transcriptase domain-containing protein, partial [Candidatus Thermoplasmatota archaeon]|nr:reverse transcriptase domain-containing protein [Candidatus Thermoplasmatota archaeon]